MTPQTRLLLASTALAALAAVGPAVAQCTPDDTTACLNGERFAVSITYADFSGGSGSAQAVPSGADDSALFYFFDANNWELLVKVLDGCGTNGHFWVFAAATTNVEYTLTVTDTESEATWSFTNPLGQTSPATADIEAFATCP